MLRGQIRTAIRKGNTMAREKDISIWSDAIDDVLFCVPPGLRLDVLRRLVDNEVKRQQQPALQPISLDYDPGMFKHWHAEMEAKSLIVQVLTRTITNNHSPDNAARVLFREHPTGTGSGWLPDYLDGLPGVVINRKRCVAITNSNGPSKLSPFFDEEAVPS
jgi:hypothetical protein